MFAVRCTLSGAEAAKGAAEVLVKLLSPQFQGICAQWPAGSDWPQACPSSNRAVRVPTLMVDLA